MGRASFRKNGTVDLEVHPGVANSLVPSKPQRNRVAAILISCGRDSREKFMPKATATTPFVASDALLNAFDINDRINQYVIDNLPGEAWRAEPPEGKGREVASIVAHIHNVRVMWLKASAKGS